MALQKLAPSDAPSSITMKSISSIKAHEKTEPVNPIQNNAAEDDVEVDLREVYFLIMHFLSDGPCHRTYGQFWNELLEHQLLPRRYHAWYSRSGAPSEDENDDGSSFPLSYNNLVERYPHIGKDHLVKLLKRLLQTTSRPYKSRVGRRAPNAADVPTVLGTGSFSLLDYDKRKGIDEVVCLPIYMRWPHMHADQVRGLNFREIGGGFSRHHRAPSIRAACYTIAKPSSMVQKMQHIKKLRGHRNAVYCAMLDSLGRYVVTGSDDRLVKIWSMETAYCLASCRGHEGDITDLAITSNNAFVASASNDCSIRVWRLPDGLPIMTHRGHAGAVTAIAYSPRLSTIYHLLSSSDDGTCRMWDVRNPNSIGVYVPKPPDPTSGKGNGASTSTVPQTHQIFCCAFNANGTVFVTGSSDTLARVWSAGKQTSEVSDQPNHEMDVLAGHENDVNYVQFSGCAVASKVSASDVSKDDSIPKFKNSSFTHDYIVTCSRDGSAIIWIPKSRRSHSKAGKWTRAYHLKVPPPPMPPQPPRGGPRQRILPTPRGVNMIIWSLDNRFVLAAIMDCRICVWNAFDGSLLHSLTGHTESTYVLDVHPFNPRIAMSAGYDGKTIVWDIWEGTPVRIYEIGRFKLVDGKFSPDGTSIVLSDDVGQLYILSTGQGESQKDAEYDQFFLGDYRPLIRDTSGNVLDQETELPPYKRNMIDLLCDSGMIPYPEPYQSTFQKRRLGSMGIEWRPQPISFAVGVDISRSQEYQMFPPLVDLDLLFDPMPQFLDALEWEPELEVPSEDTDSEYNVTEDSAGQYQGSLSVNSSCDQECSIENSDNERCIRDSKRSSRRKKLKSDIFVVTSSGRRMRKRNLDEYGENKCRKQRSKHSKFKGKHSKRKHSKEMRPQRAAARNALTLFSKMGGESTEREDEYIDSEEDSFDSGSSSTPGEDDEFYNEFQEEELENSKGETTFLEQSEVRMKPDEPENTRVRKSLVFKLAIRDPNKQTHVVVRSNDRREARPSVPSSLSEDVISHGDVVPHLLPTPGRVTGRTVGDDCAEAGLNASDGCRDGDMKWGGAKARTSKRLRFTCTYNPVEAEGNAGTCHNSEDGEFYTDEYLVDMTTCPHSCAETTDENKPSVAEVRDERPASVPQAVVYGTNDLCDEPAEKPVLAPTKFRFKSSKVVRDMADSSNPMSSTSLELNGPSKTVNNIVAHDSVDVSSLAGDVMDRVPNSISLDQMKTEPGDDRKWLAVYRRSKTCRPMTSVEEDTRCAEPGTSLRSCSPDVGRDLFGATVAGVRRARSGLHRTGRDFSVSCSKPRLRSRNGYGTHSVLPENTSLNQTSQHVCEDWGSGVGTSNVVRVTRNRRGGYHARDASPPVRSPRHQLGKKLPWSTSSMHEGSRYIPQLGDEVAYMRQGHLKYLECAGLSDDSSWNSKRGNIRVVEFCKVESLEYSFLPGSGDSCCKMMLRFVDPASGVFNEIFRLTLPELSEFPDFLVERTWYHNAIRRNWSVRDRCKVWWQNPGGENGNWWEGRVISVKDISPEFPESPWERYCIRYKSEPGEEHFHSAWELYDLDTKWEPPHIDDVYRDKLLSYMAKLENSANSGRDRYGVQKMKQTVQQSVFLNRFPAPLSLEVVRSRLENNYYRSLVAVKHDVDVMLDNFFDFFIKNAFYHAKIVLLSSFLTNAFSSL